MKTVMYHYVHPLKYVYIKGLKALDLANFENQLDYLSKHYQIIDHDILIDYFESRKQLPNNFLLLTFDDGYSDIYKYVFPSLLKRKLKGLFYVPDYHRDGKLLDVNLIHYLLTKSELVNEYIKEIQEFVSENTFVNCSYDEYIKMIVFDSRYDSKEVQVVKQMLQYILPDKIRRNIIVKLLNKYFEISEETLFNEFYCSKDQLNLMIDEGMHIGGHGVKHVWLDKLQDFEQEEEIIGSKQFLQSLNKQDFYSFCFPYGSYNSHTIELLKNSNFKFAFNTKVADFDSFKGDRFEIPRYDTNDAYPIGQKL